MEKNTVTVPDLAIDLSLAQCCHISDYSWIMKTPQDPPAYYLVTYRHIGPDRELVAYPLTREELSCSIARLLQLTTRRPFRRINDAAGFEKWLHNLRSGVDAVCYREYDPALNGRLDLSAHHYQNHFSLERRGMKIIVDGTQLTLKGYTKYLAEFISDSGLALEYAYLCDAPAQPCVLVYSNDRRSSPFWKLIPLDPQAAERWPFQCDIYFGAVNNDHRGKTVVLPVIQKAILLPDILSVYEKQPPATAVKPPLRSPSAPLNSSAVVPAPRNSSAAVSASPRSSSAAVPSAPRYGQQLAQNNLVVISLPYESVRFVRKNDSWYLRMEGGTDRFNYGSYDKPIDRPSITAQEVLDMFYAHDPLNQSLAHFPNGSSTEFLLR